MRLVTLPGVFSPISDTWLLARALRERLPAPDARVLDVCTGSGALAIAAALAGARDVTALDRSRRAVFATRLNARLNGVRVRARRSDLFAAVAGERFDLVVSNPPYVPAETDVLPERGPQRAWEAGRDGRALLDRIIAAAPRHLRPGGLLLVVHSEICGTDATLGALRAAGLAPEVAARARGPLGPLMRARIAHLEAEGLLEPGRREEDVLVLAGHAPPPSPARVAARPRRERGPAAVA